MKYISPKDTMSPHYSYEKRHRSSSLVTRGDTWREEHVEKCVATIRPDGDNFEVMIGNRGTILNASELAEIYYITSLYCKDPDNNICQDMDVIEMSKVSEL